MSCTLSDQTTIQNNADATPLRQAIWEWSRLLGTENVFCSADQLTNYTASTSPVTREVPAIIRPTSREDVIEALRIARQYQISLYPISTGRNWGYRSANPARDDSVIMDLS